MGRFGGCAVFSCGWVCCGCGVLYLAWCCFGLVSFALFIWLPVCLLRRVYVVLRILAVAGTSVNSVVH